jgi:cysteine desulfurase
MTSIYLDWNSTTPLLPEAWEAMRPLMTEAYGNPSSAHHAGRKARQALDDATERIAHVLGAHPDEVTFTSGATEANNLAIHGLSASSFQPGEKRPLIASHLEHPCVVEPLRQLTLRGHMVKWLPVSRRGTLAPDSVRDAVEGLVGPLVCVMLANHETGAIQPVREIAALLPSVAALHCDASQAVGKVPVDFHALGAATLSASAHKFRGPKGIGLLLTRRGTRLAPLLHGGHQQKGRRPGTEPVPLVVGMAIALEHAVRNLEGNHSRLAHLRASLWQRLQAQASPVVLNGPEFGASDVVPSTLNVSFPGCRADVLLMALDLKGIACSTGSACSSGSLLPSPVLTAMGVPDDVLRSALRFSFGPTTDPADIDDSAERIGAAVAMSRASTGTY